MASLEAPEVHCEHGVLQTISGSRMGQSGFASGDKPGQRALWSNPRGLLMDKENEVLYVADSSNHVVRKISLRDPSSVYLVAGQPENSGTRGGQREEAQLNEPRGLALDQEGNLYVADYGGHAIRKVRFTRDKKRNHSEDSGPWAKRQLVRSKRFKT